MHTRHRWHGVARTCTWPRPAGRLMSARLTASAARLTRPIGPFAGGERLCHVQGWCRWRRTTISAATVVAPAICAARPPRSACSRRWWACRWPWGALEVPPGRWFWCLAGAAGALISGGCNHRHPMSTPDTAHLGVGAHDLAAGTCHTSGKPPPKAGKKQSSMARMGAARAHLVASSR